MFRVPTQCWDAADPQHSSRCWFQKHFQHICCNAHFCDSVFGKHNHQTCVVFVKFWSTSWQTFTVSGSTLGVCKNVDANSPLTPTQQHPTFSTLGVHKNFAGLQNSLRIVSSRMKTQGGFMTEFQAVNLTLPSVKQWASNRMERLLSVWQSFCAKVIHQEMHSQLMQVVC